MSRALKVYLIFFMVAAVLLTVSRQSLDVRAAVPLVLLVLGSQAMASLVRYWAAARRVLDIPNARSSHSVPVPRGGGIAIVTMTLAALFLTHGLALLSLHTVILVAACSATIAVAGLVDDIRSLGMATRLFIHAAVSVVVVEATGGFQRAELPGGAIVHLSIAAVPISILWVIGLINAYNFMDGIDGIAGLQAIVAGLGWAVIGGWEKNAIVMISGFTLAATSAGFLTQNWPPARLFMGDVGSGFVGFLLAALPLLSTSSQEKSLVAGILLVWPFLFDAILTFLRRLRAGENVFMAHRSHLYQRLVITGASHQKVSLLYGCCALICAVAAIGFTRDWRGADALAGLAAACTAVGIYTTVRRAENRTSEESRRPGSTL